MGEPHALSRDAYRVHTVPHTQLYNVKSEKKTMHRTAIYTQHLQPEVKKWG